jgi:DNA-binding winged helix-turn-helix (wHTH) protein
LPEEIFQFGVFEADARTGELRKSGVKLKLQEQPFQVLVILLANPGALVTREDLRLKLWAQDTFVDFDHSLNTAINKLREVLGDSAASPRYIETLAKRGYRFIAPVTSAAIVPASARVSAATASAPQSPGTAPESLTSLMPSDSFLTDSTEVPAVSRGIPRTLFLLIQLMYLIFYIAALANLREIEGIIQSAVQYPHWLVALLIVTASVGIPIRLYLLSSVAFDYRGLESKFRKIFPALFLFDGLWAVSPFLLMHHIGFGLSLAATAALLYLPFSQRTLVFMGYARNGS